MLAHLLLPLDGSKLAEAALPAAEAIALRLNASVTLIHVLERNAPATVHGERHLADAAAAQSYLEAVARRLSAAGVRADVHVHAAPEGDLARSVVAHSEEFDPDLVVLCAHGSGGLRDLLFGSIAQQVLQRGTRPVLLVHPPQPACATAPGFAPKRVMLPLDADPEHEAAIPLAVEVARAFGATVDLACVVPTLSTLSGERAATGVLLPSATRELLQMDEDAARSYLDRLTASLPAGGPTLRKDVLRGDTAQELLQFAERTGADLIAMTSHGKVGLDALLSGSVAPRIAARAAIPLLLVRAGRS